MAAFASHPLAVWQGQGGMMESSAYRFISAAEIHARIGSGWPGLLATLGVPENYLSKKHGPCPGCGGQDRYFFDDKFGHGNFFCRKCGVGDGFKLLEYVHGWKFAEARKHVMAAMGLRDGEKGQLPVAPHLQIVRTEAPDIAKPTARIYRLRGDRCAVEDCDDAVNYLASRGLWPLPRGGSWRAHASVEYWEGVQRIGRFPALIADVRDIDDELVTVHVTYLQGGRKLPGHKPRKLLSTMTGRIGCAVRLMPAADVLGIAEGIETAASAAILEQVPVWAAINTTLLAKFEPPAGISMLRIYADRDEAGLAAAARLMERLQGRVRLELRVPTAPAKDFNDQLIAKNHSGDRHARSAY